MLCGTPDFLKMFFEDVVMFSQGKDHFMDGYIYTWAEDV